MKTLAFDKAVSFRWYDEDGRMHVDRSNLTRVQVAPYRGVEIPDWESLGLDPRKIYYGFRSAEELGNPETVKSVIGIPIQMNHHTDTPKTPAMETRVGSTGDQAEFDGTYLTNSLHIQNEDACRRIRDGSMRELSLAYYYDPDFKSPGEYEGHKYDFTMRNIRGQHLALVDEGRAGRTCIVEDSALKGVEAMTEKTAPNGAKDADPGTEKAEIKVADAMAMLSELLRSLHKPGELGETKGVGEDGDKDAKIEEIAQAFAKLGAGEDEVAALKKSLADLAYEPKAEDEAEEKKDDAEAEEAPAAEDEGESEETAEAPADPEGDKAGEEAPELDDVARDALKACGLDSESPEIQKAFAAGIRSVEKKDDTAEEKAEEPSKPEETDEKPTAQDSALKQLESKLDAIDICRPILGNVRRAAFDSADDVFVAALKQAGFPMKGVKKENARALLCGFLAGKSAGKRGTAEDAKPEDVSSGGLEDLIKVRVA